MNNENLAKLREFLSDARMSTIGIILKECLTELSLRLEKENDFPPNMQIHGSINTKGYAYPDLLIIGDDHILTGRAENTRTYKI